MYIYGHEVFIVVAKLKKIDVFELFQMIIEHYA